MLRNDLAIRTGELQREIAANLESRICERTPSGSNSPSRSGDNTFDATWDGPFNNTATEDAITAVCALLPPPHMPEQNGEEAAAAPLLAVAAPRPVDASVEVDDGTSEFLPYSLTTC